MEEGRAAKKPATVMVAMKGHPGTGKTTLARAIASSLRSPLIDKDDIRRSTSSLQSTLSLSSTTAAAAKLLNDFCYDAVWEVAATQLRLGLGAVVVDSPLSRATHLHRLLTLASSHGAHLVIVECRPSDESEWRRRLERRSGGGGGDGDSWHKPCTWGDLERLLEGYGGCTDYDVGGVPKLVVDTTTPPSGPGGVEELVSGVLEFIAEQCARPLDYLHL